MNEEKIIPKSKSIYFRTVAIMLAVMTAMLYGFQVNGQDSVVPDKLPEYKENKDGAYDLILRSIQYPAPAKERNVQGTVYISFIVNTNGQVANVHAVSKEGASNTLKEVVVVAYPSEDAPKTVERDLGLLEKEAIRVVGTLKDFHPGEVDGKPTNVTMTIPITFKLN